MAEGVKTLVAVDCDRSCEWKSVVHELKQAQVDELAGVPHEPFHGNEDDMRPTEEGYRQQALIREKYTGLVVLESLGNNCVKACAIQEFSLSKPADAFGSAVQIRVNPLRGK